MYRVRGQYRFWYPIDSRYRFYTWPKSIVAKCSGCRSSLPFEAIVPDRYVRDPDSGGYRLLDLPITGAIHGRGACVTCGRVAEEITWPQDAFYRILVGRADVWAWNEEYVKVLRARVAGDRVLERQLCIENGRYRYFLSRIPKHVVAIRNRERILRKLDEFLHARRRAEQLAR